MSLPKSEAPGTGSLETVSVDLANPGNLAATPHNGKGNPPHIIEGLTRRPGAAHAERVCGRFATLVPFR